LFVQQFLGRVPLIRTFTLDFARRFIVLDRCDAEVAYCDFTLIVANFKDNAMYLKQE